MTRTALVSGASGFIALHIVQQLLAKGYKVVGSVRSTEKGESIKSALGAGFSYYIVPDIGKAGAFDNFVKEHREALVFLHTASPFTMNVKDINKELIEPAVQGTVGALQSVHKFGPQIKKVVLTASVVAVLPFGLKEMANIGSNVYTESLWNPVTHEEALADPWAGYCASKTFAEKAAWDFVEKEEPHFSLVGVNPAYVFGPQAIAPKGALNFSSEIINSVLNAKPDSTEYKTQAGAFVDVRDVARAHVLACDKEELQGKRLLLVSAPYIGQTLLDLVHKNFPKEAANVPVGNPGELLEGKVPAVDNSATRKLLGFEFIGLEQSVVDSAKQIYAAKL